jgi:hypothetical protein
MITLRRCLIAMVVAIFAVAAPVTAQSAGSYQKEPMFPDLASVGHVSSPSPSQFLECGKGRYWDLHQNGCHGPANVGD